MRLSVLIPKVLPNFLLAASPAHSAIVASSPDQKIGLQEAAPSSCICNDLGITSADLLVSRAIPPHVNKLPG